ncbi:GGDEF domain-containing protein [uncultured Pseudokineococcus sp.]|uniref:GGDEF domain-containing protein n=1 Tax=uncultured Pseudokineococcus sp. TaxID=1642928 RepID=UPI00261F18A4|nr:GGDEF domain-containing protein [uncultured Pseudokineococcus sp.]
MSAAPGRRAVVPLVAGAAVLGLGSLVVPEGPRLAAGTGMSVLLQLAAAVVVVAGLRAAPARRRVLVPLLGALVLWALGMLGVLLEVLLTGEPSFPSAVEGLFVAAFLGFAAAVLLDLDAGAATRPRAVVALETVVLVGGGVSGAAGVIAAALLLGAVGAVVALGLLHAGVWATLLVLVVVQCARRTRPWDARSGALLAGLALMVVSDAALFVAAGDFGEAAGLLRLAVSESGLLLLALALSRPPSPASWGTSGVGVPAVVAASTTALGLLAVRPALPAPFGGYVAGTALTTSLAATALLGLALAGARSASAAHALARTDELTGAANRRALREEVARPGAGGVLGLVLVDLDGFKQVNDEHGHAAGDAVLVATAHRLRAAAGPGDLVVRLGGDEFAVLVRGAAASEAGVEALARRCRTALAAPLALGEVVLAVDGSLGTARRLLGGRTRDDAEEALDALLRQADRAMYAVKAARAARPPRPRRSVEPGEAEGVSAPGAAGRAACPAGRAGSPGCGR